MRITKVSIVIIFLVLGSFPWLAFSQSAGIVFENGDSWSRVVGKARESNKFIFLDCYASWCGPCKMMDRNVYSNAEVGKYFNEKFICVRVQIDTSKNDDQQIRKWYGDAHEIREKYQINALPTLLFFSPDGKLVHKGLGYHDAEEFIKLGENAMRPGDQYYTLLERYRPNELHGAIEMARLVTLANDVGDFGVAHKVANDYINRLSATEMLNKANIPLIYQYTKSSKDRGFAFFRDSANLIYKADTVYSAAVSKGLLITVIGQEEIKPFEQSRDGKPDWDRIENNIKRYGSLGKEAYEEYYKVGIVFRAIIVPEMEKLLAWPEILKLIKKQQMGDQEKYLITNAIVFYEKRLNHGQIKDCRNFISAIRYCRNRYPEVTKSPQLNEYAFNIFLYDENHSDLKEALHYAKFAADSADPENKPNCIDTYANLLFKLGKKQDAIGWEKRAIAMNPRKSDSTYVKTLQKMESDKLTGSPEQ